MRTIRFRKRLGGLGKTILSEAKAWSIATVESFVPGVALATKLAEKGWALGKLGYAEVRDRVDKKSPEQAAICNQTAFLDALFEDVQKFCNAQNGASELTPFVFIIDDAQWADHDGILNDFYRRLFDAGIKRNWPVLIIISYWENLWNNRIAVRDKSSIPFFVTGHNNRAENIKVVMVRRIPNLRSVVHQKFPGLTSAQIMLIEDRCGGNGGLLRELLNKLQHRSRYFEENSIDQALSPRGEKFLNTVELNFHDLLYERIGELSEDDRLFLAVSSLQGFRFSNHLTTIVCKEIVGAPTETSIQSLSTQTIVSVVDDDIFEFSDKPHWEIASRLLEQLEDFDYQEIIAAFERNIIELAEDISSGSGSYDRFCEILFRLCWDRFRAAENIEKRASALQYASDLVQIYYSQGQFQSASALAVQVWESIQQGETSLDILSYQSLRWIADGLVAMRGVSNFLPYFDTWLELAKTRAGIGDDLNLLSDYGMTCICVGNTYLNLSNYEKANDLLKIAVAIARKVVEKDRNQFSLNRLSMSLDMYGLFLWSTHQWNECEDVRSEDLAICEEIFATESGNEAKRNLAFTLELKAKAIQMKCQASIETANLDEALSLVDRSICLFQEIDSETSTLRSRSDYAMSLTSKSSMLNLAQRYSSALHFAQEATDIYRNFYAIEENIGTHFRYMTSLLNLSATYRNICVTQSVHDRVVGNLAKSNLDAEEMLARFSEFIELAKIETTEYVARSTAPTDSKYLLEAALFEFELFNLKQNWNDIVLGYDRPLTTLAELLDLLQPIISLNFIKKIYSWVVRACTQMNDKDARVTFEDKYFSIFFDRVNSLKPDFEPMLLETLETSSSLAIQDQNIDRHMDLLIKNVMVAEVKAKRENHFDAWSYLTRKSFQIAELLYKSSQMELAIGIYKNVIGFWQAYIENNNVYDAKLNLGRAHGLLGRTYLSAKDNASGSKHFGLSCACFEELLEAEGGFQCIRELTETYCMWAQFCFVYKNKELGRIFVEKAHSSMNLYCAQRDTPDATQLRQKVEALTEILNN